MADCQTDCQRAHDASGCPAQPPDQAGLVAEPFGQCGDAESNAGVDDKAAGVEGQAEACQLQRAVGAGRVDELGQEGRKNSATLGLVMLQRMPWRKARAGVMALAWPAGGCSGAAPPFLIKRFVIMPAPFACVPPSRHAHMLRRNAGRLFPCDTGVLQCQ